MKKGELIYVPSNVVLFDNHLNKGTTRCKETEAPIQVLCLGHEKGSENFLRILHEGEQWSVHRRDVTEITNAD